MDSDDDIVDAIAADIVNGISLSESDNNQYDDDEVILSNVKDEVKDKKDGKKKKEDEKVERVGFLELFKYATALDVFLIVMGTIAAMGRGVLLPGFSLIFGDIVDVLAKLELSKFDPMSDAVALEDELVNVSLRFLYFAAGAFVVSWAQTTCWMLAGQRQSDRIRRHYVRAVLRQEIGWFDKEGANEVYSRLSGDLVVISEGISEKCGSAVQFLAQFVAGFALGFYQGWELTLVILAVSPLLAISAAIMMFLLASMTNAGQKAYARAGAIALEVISGIRTVAAFGGEEREVKRYSEEIAIARRSGIKKAWVGGLGFGFVMLCIYGSYALAMWYGATRIEADDVAGVTDGYTGGTVLTVLFAVLIGAFSLGQIAPSATAVSSAQGAAFTIFGTIERASQCDPFAPPADLDDVELSERNVALKQSFAEGGSLVSDPHGERLLKLKGRIKFKDVKFRYPTRASVQVLDGIDLDVRPGQTIALVGESGCGKSTTLSLVERFYEPESGQITIDGVPLKDLNINWWRQQIGYVGQQPVLFSGTIAENIALGWAMSFKESITFDRQNLPVSREQIIRAAKSANAHDFISEFAHGYDTVVGSKGAQLSGGQKQRIAIARAIVRDPTVLLLDEATSALDSRSEAVVQEALDNASRDRTTLVIAHRLSTIRDANTICVFDKGVIVERGSFDELVARKSSRFYKMVRLQGLVSADGTVGANIGNAEVAESSSSETDSDAPPPLPVTRAPRDDDDDDEDGEGKKKSRPTDDSEDPDAGKLKRLSLKLSRRLSLSKIETDDSEATPKKKGKKAKKAKKAKKSKKGKKEVIEDVASTMDMHGLEDLAEQQAAEEEADSEDVEEEANPLGRVYRLNKPELCYYIVGAFFAIANGVKDPAFAFVFTEMLVAFNQPPSQILEEATKYALLFVYIGLGTMVAVIGQTVCFGIGAERLTERVRNLTFQAILRQEVAFFDSKKHDAGVLAARLAQDASMLSGMFGDPLAVTIQNLATAVVGLGIAFYYSWKMTLLVLATVPVLIFGQAMEFIAMKGFQASAQDDVARATALASEAIGDIRTVAALTTELTVCTLYERTLLKPAKVASARAWVIGFLTGLSQAMMFGSYTLNFWFGGTLILDGELGFDDMMKVFMAILFSAMGMGQASALLPDASKARAAATSIFKLLDRQSLCDPTSTDGKPPLGDGNIELAEVEFAYPTRRRNTVLRGLNVSVKKGQTLALCGESGCGKSTSIGLIQRFYEPQQGHVLIDGDDLSTLNVRRWRRRIGLVLQEPQLFTGTIKDNIIYGIPDDERDTLTNEMLEKAAKDANAYAFIMKLPNGFDTDLGENGAQLSGGQKQRIAIARAIIRDPSVLLLDEATSALDEKAQKIVQSALEKAMKGRTTITIAHRLSTVKDADKIAVISKGRVVEEGTHRQLLKNKGPYYRLVRRQTSDPK